VHCHNYIQLVGLVFVRLRYLLLLLFLLLSLGPLLLFRAWPYSAVLQGELDEVHERHLLLANNLAAALERYHQDLVTTFELLLDTPETWTRAGPINRVLTNLNFQHVCIVDWGTGRVLTTLATESVPCPDTVPAATMASLTALVEPDTVAFSSVVETSTGENVIHMVKKTGENLAIGTIKTSYFRELGEAISFGVMGHAAIVDHTGLALSHPLADWVATRKDMSQISAVQRMLNHETGVEIFYSPALKGDMIAGFTFVDPVGWGVMIPQPLSELYERAADARQSSFIVLLIGTISALTLALIVSWRVVRPLEQISHASAMIADGKLSVPKPDERARFLPTELRELQNQFHKMVRRLGENMSTINVLIYVDAITGLGNRAFFQKSLDVALSNGDQGSLLLIDLDGFKSVNDMHGHDGGDKVLRILGNRLCQIAGIPRLEETTRTTVDDLSTCGNASAFVSRLGGDEFVMWLPTANGEDVKAAAESILTQMRDKIYINDIEVKMGASVGIARYPRDGADRTNLVKAADLAMYEAKKSGKNQYLSFLTEMKTAVIAKRQLGHEIEAGLRNGQFLPYFQPQFSLPDRRISGVEALARWQHPERGLLNPSDFIDTAEEVGLLTEIDATILEQSVQCLSELAKTDMKIASLAVNISEKRLISPDLLETLSHFPILPFELRFELLETMTLDKIEGRLAWTLDIIREKGYLLDLDDFGSANASVLGLMNVEPSHLKIDRNLIMGMKAGNVAERLVRSIIEMGHSLEIPIIAEGAEDMTCVRLLEALDCDFVQGFALARPGSYENLVAFVQSYSLADSQPMPRIIRR
jgi:predicted signal transduction protein with EAL and GGDEF domain